MNPEAIFLLGGLANAGDLIFHPTQLSMKKNLFPVFRGKVKILSSRLKGDIAAVLGAGALAWKVSGLSYSCSAGLSYSCINRKAESS